jgi:ABC-type phosphate/phosphonate transport system ATPase subunit
LKKRFILLKEKAKREKVSIGRLVREAVATCYGIKNKEDRLRALDSLKSLNLAVSDPEIMEKEIIGGAINDKES